MFAFLKHEIRAAARSNPMLVPVLESRNRIMIMAISLMPVSSVIVIVLLLMWKAEAGISEWGWLAGAFYPVVALAGVVLGLIAHKFHYYALAGLLVFAPVINLIIFMAGLVMWLWTRGEVQIILG
jgi:hypothetical protein